MKAEILPAHTPDLFRAAVQKAADLLRRGQVVALPTETVYGLAANALNQAAVGEIFEVKQRPAHNPIIVHVESIAMAKRCVRDWPALADELARTFWPGPLTLVLPRAPVIPDVVTAGGDTVGIRWPRHALFEAVIRACGFPLAAPSANPSNRVSPTTAEHVYQTLGDRIPLVVDGGPSHVGIESTVLDLTVSPPMILRPGMVGEEALTSVAGRITAEAPRSGTVHKSPGRLPRHYSPKARLVVSAWQDGDELRRLIAATGVPLSSCHIIAVRPVDGAEGFGRVAVLPRDPGLYAKALYAELHRSDAAGAKLVVTEAVPQTPAWRGIADRLKRASQGE